MSQTSKNNNQPSLGQRNGEEMDNIMPQRLSLGPNPTYFNKFKNILNNI